MLPVQNKTKTVAYNSWARMKQACINPRAPGYRYAGAKGATYDPAWESFDAFLHDMGDPPHGYTLARKNKSLPFCRANCVWAPRWSGTRKGGPDPKSVIQPRGKRTIVVKSRRELPVR